MRKVLRAQNAIMEKLPGLMGEVQDTEQRQRPPPPPQTWTLGTGSLDHSRAGTESCLLPQPPFSQPCQLCRSPGLVPTLACNRVGFRRLCTRWSQYPARGLCGCYRSLDLERESHALRKFEEAEKRALRVGLLSLTNSSSWEGRKSLRRGIRSSLLKRVPIL